MPHRCPSVALLILLSTTAFPGAPADSSLYARLGGASNVTAFVDVTLEHAALSRSDRTRVRDRLIAKICALSGGGCRDSDRDETPASMVEELRRAMRAQQVPLSARNELLDLLTRR